MDWQTKEYVDERLDALDEKMDLLLQHFNINTEDEDLDEEVMKEDIVEEEDVI